MKACRHREKGIKAIEILLTYGADINALAMPKQDLRTPLHYAVLSGCIPLVAFLIEVGLLFLESISLERSRLEHAKRV